MAKKINEAIPSKKKSATKIELEQALIDNFTNLQKVLTNLAVKFEELSSNISKLLQLFEISAKSFAEKYSENKEGKDTEIDGEFLKKLDSLLDQNKTIAKGIMLMEERIRGRDQPMARQEELRQRIIRNRPLPKY